MSEDYQELEDPFYNEDRFQQPEFRRSNYGDMLHDDERNQAYDVAITEAVDYMIKHAFETTGKKPEFRCLDIGTGSGILAMMIARAFITRGYFHFHVDAVEANHKIASCANMVIDHNDYSRYITVHPDALQRTQILKMPLYSLIVAELLDTQLFTEESALHTYYYAKSLALPDCIYIPHKATIYGELIASRYLYNRRCLNDVYINLGNGTTVHIEPFGPLRDCTGDSLIDEMHASRLEEGKDFHRFTEPQVLFEYVLGEVTREQTGTQLNKVFYPVKKLIREPTVIAFWWDVEMFDATRFLPNSGWEHHILTSRPSWAKDEKLLRREKRILEKYGRDCWREHWLQGFFVFESAAASKDHIKCRVGDIITVYVGRDHQTYWFNHDQPSDEPYACSCDAHRSLGPSQILHYNDKETLTTVFKSLFKNRPHRHYVASFNELFELSFDIYDNGIKTCTDLRYSTIVTHALDRMFITNTSISSYRFTQVIYKNLSRVKLPIGQREGFDFGKLDQMLDLDSSPFKQDCERRSMWEYEIIRIDPKSYETPCEKVRITNPLRLGYTREQLANGWGFVFWRQVEYLNTRDMVSTGPIGDTKAGQVIQWPKTYSHYHNFLHRLAAIPSFNLESFLVKVEIADTIEVTLS